MAKNASFDIVSEIDFQEVDNAINQAKKEIQQRYDLKDSNTELELNKKDKLMNINTKDDYSLKQSIDILQTKFIKRGISIKSLKMNEPEAASGGRIKQKIDLQSGISKENAKKITNLIKTLKLKVNAQIMDEKVRVQGAKIDDLQEVIKEETEYLLNEQKHLVEAQDFLPVIAAVKGLLEDEPNVSKILIGIINNPRPDVRQLHTQCKEVLKRVKQVLAIVAPAEKMTQLWPKLVKMKRMSGT